MYSLLLPTTSALTLVLIRIYSFYECAPYPDSWVSKPAPDCQEEEEKTPQGRIVSVQTLRRKENRPLGCFNSFSSPFSFPLGALRPWAPPSEEITTAQRSFVMLRPQPSTHQPSAGSLHFLQPRPVSSRHGSVTQTYAVIKTSVSEAE